MMLRNLSALKTVSKNSAIQKAVEATGGFIGNDIADKIASRASQIKSRDCFTNR